MQNLTHPAPGSSDTTGVTVASARISSELESATEDVHNAISNVRTKLLGLVQQEVKSLFQDALGGAGTAIAYQVIGENSPEPAHTAEEPAGEVPSDPEPPQPQVRDMLGLDAASALDLAPPSAVKEAVSEPEEDPVPDLVAESPAFLDLLSLNGFHAGDAPGQAQARPDEVVYEGTVRLTVVAPGCVREVIHFVDHLCGNPHLRLLQLVGNHRTDRVDIWLGLREPLQLRPLLLEMDSVARVDTPLGYGPNGNERLVEVRLS